MKTTVFSIATALLVAATAASAAPNAIDGAWTAKVPSPNGQMSLDVVFNFKADGSTLTGTATASGNTYDLVETRISGANIEFTVEGEPARYAGTLNGDEIKMQVTFKSHENGTRTWSFVAKRADAASGRAGQASIDGEWTGEVPRGGSRFIYFIWPIFSLDGGTRPFMRRYTTTFP